MSKESLNEREFELINILGDQLGVNQRELSNQMNMSLGMVNMLIKRLVVKGFIRIEQLNKRKVRYLLTSQGFSEKIQKSIKYAWKTINSIGSIKGAVYDCLENLCKEGQRNFYIYGESDFGKLVEAVLQELKSYEISWQYIEELPGEALDGVVLKCKEHIEVNEVNKSNSVDLVRQLVQNQNLMLDGRK